MANSSLSKFLYTQRFQRTQCSSYPFFYAFYAPSSEQGKVLIQWPLFFLNPNGLRVVESGFGRSNPVKRHTPKATNCIATNSL